MVVEAISQTEVLLGEAEALTLLFPDGSTDEAARPAVELSSEAARPSGSVSATAALGPSLKASAITPVNI